jgi:hypothetical protein
MDAEYRVARQKRNQHLIFFITGCIIGVTGWLGVDLSLKIIYGDDATSSSADQLLVGIVRVLAIVSISVGLFGVGVTVAKWKITRRRARSTPE